MYLKKVCKRDGKGNKLVPYQYTHMEPMNRSKTFAKLWNPSKKFVAMGIDEGWLHPGFNEDGTMGTLTFVTAPGKEDIAYRVNREPMEFDANGQLVVRPEKPGHVLRANQYLCERVA